MPPEKKTILVLAQLKRNAIFKIVKPMVGGVSLTLDGVYRVSAAKADHGRTVKNTRPCGNKAGAQRDPSTFSIEHSLGNRDDPGSLQNLNWRGLGHSFSRPPNNPPGNPLDSYTPEINLSLGVMVVAFLDHLLRVYQQLD